MLAENTVNSVKNQESSLAVEQSQHQKLCPKN